MKKREYRFVKNGFGALVPARIVDPSERYVIVRRSGAAPFVIRATEWENAEPAGDER